MKVSTPEGPDSQTVYLVGARRKNIRTSLSYRLHGHLNYLLSYRNNSNNKTKQKTNPLNPKLQPLVMTKWNFPLEITSFSISDLNKRYRSVIFRNTQHPPLHHLKPELLCSPSRLLELAQMSVTAHLTLSFFTSAFLSGFPKQVQEQSCGNHMEEQ